MFSKITLATKRRWIRKRAEGANRTGTREVPLYRGQTGKIDSGRESSESSALSDAECAGVGQGSEDDG